MTEGRAMRVALGVRFVGRVLEQEHLRARLQGAAAGQGSLLLVRGEPGIGKTRLVANATGAAAAEQMRVIWGACDHEAGPLWPWRQVLRSLPDDATSLLERYGGGADARFRLADGVGRALVDASGDRPLVVVLDDMHWADPATVEVLRVVARLVQPHPILLIAIYRHTEPNVEKRLAPVLEDLAGTGGLMEVAGLSAAEVGSVVEAIGLEVPVLPLHARTGGNPFFVLESLRMLRKHLAAGGSPDAQVLPAGVAAVLRRRLDDLSDRARQVLEVGAMAGGRIDRSLVAEVLEVPESEADSGLEEAVAAGVLVRTALPYPTLRFAHDLLRETALAGIDQARRPVLHWRIGVTLAGRPDARAHHHAVASHLDAGLEAGDRRIAVQAARAAATASTHALAFEQAADHLRAALEIGGTDDQELLVALGHAHRHAARFDDAADAFARAAELAHAAGRTDVLVEAALGMGGGRTGFQIRVGDPRQITLLDQALKALGPEPSSERAYLLARRSVAGAHVHPSEVRVAWSKVAVRCAQQVADARAEAAAWAAYCDAIAGPMHVEERRVAAARVIDVARRAGDEQLVLLGHRTAAIAALELGDVAGADTAIAAFTVLATRGGDPHLSWYVPLWRGMRALMRGDPASAEHAADEVERIGDLVASVDARDLAIRLRTPALAAQGRAQPFARACVDELLARLQQLPTDASAHGDLAHYAVILDDETVARQALDGLSSLDYGSHDRDGRWLSSMTFAAHAALLVRDDEACHRLHDLLVPFARLHAVDSGGAAVIGPVKEIVAELAAVAPHDSTPSRNVPVAEGRRAQRRGIWRRHGDAWEVGLGDRVVLIGDAKGVRDIAVLITHAGRDVHVFDLTATGVHSGDIEVLDNTARHQYARRVVALEEDIARAEGAGDADAAARAGDEREWLVTQLSAAAGLRGRPRIHAAGQERARQSVGARIRYTLRRLRELDPHLADHLRRGIHLGTYCRYDPDTPVTWDVSVSPLTNASQGVARGMMQDAVGT